MLVHVMHNTVRFHGGVLALIPAARVNEDTWAHKVPAAVNLPGYSGTDGHMCHSAAADTTNQLPMVPVAPGVFLRGTDELS